MSDSSISVIAACSIAFAAACGGGKSGPAEPDGGFPGQGGPTGSTGSTGPTGAATASLTVSVSGSGKITSAPAGLDCTGTCAASFPVGTVIALTATAGANARFLGWGGSTCTGAGDCSFTLSSDATVYASFAIQDPPPPPPPPPPSPVCAALAPDDEAMHEFVHDPFTGFCGGGTGDQSGTLALYVQHETGSLGDHGIYLDFVTSAGKLLVEQSAGTGRGSVTPEEQPNGVAAVTYTGWPNYLWKVLTWDSTGAPAGQSNSFMAGNFVKVGDPYGGRVLVAGDLETSPSGPWLHSAMLFEANGGPMTTQWGQKPLSSRGAVFGAGVDTIGRTLVITDGSAKFGGGAISGEWLDRDGASMTGEFLLLSGFTAGEATWFETAALIGGGLAVRRVDNPSSGPYQAQWMLVVPSGSASARPAPAWMAARPNARLQIVRSGRAYAVLPDRAVNVACTQRVEVVATDGTSCGARDYPIAAGTCNTNDLTLGADGTVIQQLPAAMETQTPIGAHTCTWHWWPGAIR